MYVHILYVVMLCRVCKVSSIQRNWVCFRADPPVHGAAEGVGAHQIRDVCFGHGPSRASSLSRRISMGLAEESAK
jgi:hypothetical protein